MLGVFMTFNVLLPPGDNCEQKLVSEKHTFEWQINILKVKATQ